MNEQNSPSGEPKPTPSSNPEPAADEATAAGTSIPVTVTTTSPAPSTTEAPAPATTESAAAPITSEPATTASAPSASEVVVTTDDIVTPESTTPDQITPPIEPVKPAAPPKRKKLLAAIGVIVAVAIAIGAAVLLTSSTPVSKTITVAKKDIASVQVVSFDPLSHTYYPDMQSYTEQYDVNMQLFEGLTKFVNDTELKPGLADSWTNPDSSTWVFKLHPNVKFHTGKVMTATDVKGSLDAIKTTDYGKTYASTIKTVTVVDPLTVKIQTDGSDPLLANELASLFIYDTTSAKKNDAVNGTGPYTLASDTKTDIKLTAFDGYHGGHVYTRAIDYHAYDAATDIPAAAITNHQIQVISFTNAPDLLTKLTAANYTVQKLPTYAVGHLVFNTSHVGSPFANLKVRKAVAQAIDTKKLIAVSKSDAIPAGQTIANGIPGYNPAIKPVVFSETAAKTALTAAGYPNGFSFKLTFYPSPRNTAITTEVKKELAAIGITVNLDSESDQNKIGDIAFGGGTDMYLTGVNSNVVDGSDILSDFIDSPNYTSATLDKLNDQASTELNPAKRVVILQQMAKFIEDDQADIPLFQDNTQVLSSAPSIVAHRDTIVSSVGVYYWQTYAK
jgi:peptide/nickel transport system substrate-binding protein